MLYVTDPKTNTKYAVKFIHGQAEVELPSGKIVEREVTQAQINLVRDEKDEKGRNLLHNLFTDTMVVNPNIPVNKTVRRKEALGVALRNSSIAKADRSVFWDAFFAKWPKATA